jgi:hypothetical protein
MNITTKRNPIHFYYNMHGHILESVQHTQYLGVTISTHLKWNTHIKQTATKANKSLCFNRRNLKVQSQTIKERAYQTLIRPKLEYGCTIWDPRTNENINSLEKVQRQDARYTCNRHHNTSSVSEILNTMNWQTLQERRLRTRLIMFHKVINENIAIQNQSMTRSSPERLLQTNPMQ